MEWHPCRLILHRTRVFPRGRPLLPHIRDVPENCFEQRNMGTIDLRLFQAEVSKTSVGQPSSCGNVPKGSARQSGPRTIMGSRAAASPAESWGSRVTAYPMLTARRPAATPAPSLQSTCHHTPVQPCPATARPAETRLVLGALF